MFGYVMASFKELEQEQKDRYQAVYCGICRQIRLRSSNLSRLGLSYDMTFLALLLMSLYEPEEAGGKARCFAHPLRQNPWVENDFISYAADMNVALAYYNADDDWQDDRKVTAKWMTQVFGKHMDAIRQRWPRQCDAIAQCIAKLSELESQNCGNPDEPANCFGELMGSLLVYKEDLWAPTLGQMGQALGRFIYLADAAVDYRRDKRKGKYNPYLQMDPPATPAEWDEFLVLAMGKCTREFEKLPLVQDKGLLDNILYSGVWGAFRGKKKKQEDGT